MACFANRRRLRASCPSTAAAVVRIDQRRFGGSTMNSAKRNRGFGIVELMTSIASGMVVSGAAVSFLVASMNSNTNYVRTARFTQDLRNNMNFVTGELRRAGY